MKKILFVCLGNICRSPMAEAIFNHKVREKGLSALLVADSAGTANYHVGEDPDPRTVETVRKNKVTIQHKGQQFKKKHEKQFDFLIAMDASNHSNMITELGHDDHVYMIRDFDPIGKGDVPDPYYGGHQGFDHVYEMLDRSIENLIDFIKKEADL